MSDLDLSFSASDLPWPKPTSRLFGDDGDCEFIAWVPKSSKEWCIYAEGYREAADRLLEQIGNGVGTKDFLVYPIVFLYRHFVELKLKEIIQDSRNLLDIEASLALEHRLDRLWKDARALLEEVEQHNPAATNEVLDDAERLILELHGIDATSTVFRYPRDRDGKPHDLGSDYLSLDRFREGIQDLAAFLDGASMQVSVYLDWKREQYSDYHG